MVWHLADPSSSSGGSRTSRTGRHPSLAAPPLHSPTREPGRRPPASSLASSSSLSLRSSSLGLGPTPGSNLALDSQSEYDGPDSDLEDEAMMRPGMTDSLTVFMSRRASPSPTPSSLTSSRGSTTVAAASINGGAYASIETGTDPLAWTEDVESMLNNPPPDTFQSFILSSEPSLSSWVVPPAPLHHHQHQTATDYSPFGFARRGGVSKSSTSPPEPPEDFTHHFSPAMLEKWDRQREEEEKERVKERERDARPPPSPGYGWSDAFSIIAI